MSNSLQPHGLQHTRLPGPSLSPGIRSNSCPLSRWCCPTISSSVTPFSSCPQSFPAAGSFSVSWLFSSGGQSIGASASASVLPVNIQGWFPLGLTDFLAVQGTLKSLLQHHSLKASTLHWKAGMCTVGGERLLVVTCWSVPQDSRTDFKCANNICKHDHWT